MDNKYIITKVDDGIYYIDDFLSKEEMDVMMSECLEEDGWYGEGGAWENNLKECTHSRELRQEINTRLEAIINNDEEESNSNTIINRLRVSTGNGTDWALGVHADNHEYGDGRSVNVTKGYVIYFNDDFEGGETVYINKGIEIKPKAGRMLVHSGYKEYTHAVKHVISGTRYFITGFVFKKGTLVKSYSR